MNCIYLYYLGFFIHFSGIFFEKYVKATITKKIELKAGYVRIYTIKEDRPYVGKQADLERETSSARKAHFLVRTDLRNLHCSPLYRVKPTT